MEIQIPLELIEICKEIADKNLPLEEWCKIGSSDMFQTNHFNGGFDALEKAFCFSYYNSRKNEFWFQVTLEEIDQIIKGEKKTLTLEETP